MKIKKRVYSYCTVRRKKSLLYCVLIVIFLNFFWISNNIPQIFQNANISQLNDCLNVNISATCTEYNSEIGYAHQVHANFYNTNMTSDSADDVTMVTQLTSSRLAALQRLASYWQGWMSVAVYVEEALLSNLKLQVGQWLRETNRSNIAVSFVVKRGVSHELTVLIKLGRGFLFIILISKA